MVGISQKLDFKIFITLTLILTRSLKPVMRGKHFFSTTTLGVAYSQTPMVSLKSTQHCAFFDVRTSQIAQRNTILDGGRRRQVVQKRQVTARVSAIACTGRRVKWCYVELLGSFVRQKMRNAEYFSVIPLVFGSMLLRE